MADEESAHFVNKSRIKCTKKKHDSAQKKPKPTEKLSPSSNNYEPRMDFLHVLTMHSFTFVMRRWLNTKLRTSGVVITTNSPKWNGKKNVPINVPTTDRAPKGRRWREIKQHSKHSHESQLEEQTEQPYNDEQTTSLQRITTNVPAVVPYRVCDCVWVHMHATILHSLRP